MSARITELFVRIGGATTVGGTASLLLNDASSVPVMLIFGSSFLLAGFVASLAPLLRPPKF